MNRPSHAPMPNSIRVFMLDLFSIVPYYTGRLCASLQAANRVQVTLASITYQHDPECFRRLRVHNDPGPLNLTYRLQGAPAAARRLLKLGEYVVNMAALLFRLALSRPEILHVQFLPLLAYGVPLEEWWLRIVRTLRIPIVYTVHNLVPQDSGERHAATYRRIYHLADRLICHDGDAASRLAAQFQVPAERVFIVPHGPLLEDTCSARDQARRRLCVAPDECLVLWQGIVRPYKGLSFLMKTWRQVCERNGTARLAIVGAAEPSLAEAIKKEANDLGIEERTRLELRFVPVDELADFYEAADILVYPYRNITTSGALMTGIARGKAVVATALPAFEQILRHGDNALLVSYGDVTQFTAALLRLIGDPVLRRQLGSRLRDGRLPLWTDIARSTCACYESALCAAPKHALAAFYK